jgi:hypothetical protein
VSCGLWRCCGVEEALGVIRLLCSDTLSVRLCQLGLGSTRCTLWRILGGEGSQLEGMTCGPRSLEPLKPAEEFVFLRDASCMILSTERLTEPCLQGSAGEPSKPWWLKVPLLSLGLSWCRGVEIAASIVD